MDGRLGSYELQGELGRGGMGRVYKARHLPTGALRAVKVMTAPPDPEAVVRFRREVEVLARLAGRGVVPVHDAGVERGQLWFAMSFMGGGSLRTRLRAEGRLPWRDAVRLALELGRVLDRCHSAGIVHRDVKPDNVLLDDEGNPSLADWGCVRDLGASGLTETGTALGTVSYMAPELLDGQPADARSDLYALAVVLHELVLGAPPFARATTLVAELAARGKERPRVAAVGAPAELDAILDRALAARRERTVSTARFADELEGLLAGDDGTHAPRQGRFLAVALLLAVASVAGLGLLVDRERSAAEAAVEGALADLADAGPALERVREAALVGAITSASRRDLEMALHVAERASEVARRATRPLVFDGTAAVRSAEVVLASARSAGRALRAAELLAGGSPSQALVTLAVADRDAATALLRARILVVLGDAAAAEEAVLPATAAGRHRAEAFELLGDARLRRNDPARAREAFGSALELEPTPSRREKRALAALGAGDVEGALADLATIAPALPLERARSSALAPFAKVLYERGVESPGSWYLDAAWRLADPPEELRGRVLARWLEEANAPGEMPLQWPADFAAAKTDRRLARAVELSRRLQTLEPSARLDTLWGLVLGLRSYYAAHKEEVLELARVAFAPWQEHPLLLYLEARCATEHGKAKESVVLFCKALRALPRRRDEEPLEIGLLASEIVRFGFGAFDEVHSTRAEVEAFRAGVERAGRHSEAWTWAALGECYIYRKELKESRVCLEKAGDPTDPDVRRLEVRLLQEEGKKEEALERARLLARDSPLSLDHHLYITALEATRGWQEIVENVRVIPEAVRTDAIAVDEYVLRATALKALRREDEAEALIVQLTELNASFRTLVESRVAADR